MKRTIITGTGSYIPDIVQTNAGFEHYRFFNAAGAMLPDSNESILKKFREITGIEERRYAAENISTAEMAAAAAKTAIERSGIDPETLQQIIVAHNFGDFVPGRTVGSAVPSVASRLKHLLGIRNSSCITFDLLMGCAGWVQAFIQTDASFKAGIASRALIVGAEMLSRVVDKSDRDCMLFSDGAGACVVEFREEGPKQTGFIGAAAQSDCLNELNYIRTGSPNQPELADQEVIKMNGRKVYEYAIARVPLAMKKCLDDNGIGLRDVKCIVIHQANEKLDQAILEKLFQLYGETVIPKHIMPMSIQWLGNSSVATVPTLFDLICTGKMQDTQLAPGDIVLFASVGAGMNLNCICYRM